MQNRPALAPAAERRAVRSFRARWPLVGVFLLFANLLGAAWNLGVLSLAQDVWKPSGRRPRPTGRHRLRVRRGLEQRRCRRGERERAATTAAAQDSEREASVGRSRVHRRRRVFVAWRALPGPPDGHSVTRFTTRVCSGLGPLPPMQIDTLGRFELSNTLRGVRVRLVGNCCRRSCARHDHNEWERLCEERSLRGQDLLALRIESTLLDHCVDQEVRRECCRGREEPCLTAVGEFSDTFSNVYRASKPGRSREDRRFSTSCPR